MGDRRDQTGVREPAMTGVFYSGSSCFGFTMCSFVLFVPVGRRRWLQRIEGTGLVQALVVSIPIAPRPPPNELYLGLSTLQWRVIRSVRPAATWTLGRLAGNLGTETTCTGYRFDQAVDLALQN